MGVGVGVYVHPSITLSPYDTHTHTHCLTGPHHLHTPRGSGLDPHWEALFCRVCSFSASLSAARRAGRPAAHPPRVHRLGCIQRVSGVCVVHFVCVCVCVCYVCCAVVCACVCVCVVCYVCPCV